MTYHHLHASTAQLAGPIQRIAVFRALYLGDLLLAIPALRALRSGFPHAEITLISLPWAVQIVRRFPHYLDRFVTFQGFPGLAEMPVIPQRTAAFLTQQRAHAYDLVVQLHGSGRASTPFALALGARNVVGYFESARPHGLTLGLPYPMDQPEVWRNLTLARLLGCPDLRTQLEFPLTASERAHARLLLARFQPEKRFLVGMHVGASAPSRRWPVERFAAVADALAQSTNARIVLTGATSEAPLARTVAAFMHTPALNLAGQTSLGTLGAVLAATDLVLSNDTGPAHLAEAVGTPVITLFGPGDPRRWAPLDQSRNPIVREPVTCSPCAFRACPIDHRCLRRISVARVVSVARDVLASQGGVACDA